jgi:hypothetical protein
MNYFSIQQREGVQFKYYKLSSIIRNLGIDIVSPLLNGSMDF